MIAPELYRHVRAAFLIFSHAALLLLCARAEDPARFIAVTNWYGTFTRTLQSSGHIIDPGGCEDTWSFSHAGSISSQLKRMFSLPGMDPSWNDVGSTNRSLMYSIQDRGVQRCGDTSTTYEGRQGSSMHTFLDGCNLEINLAETNYTIGFGYVVGLYDGFIDGEPFVPSGINWFPNYGFGPITNTLPGSGMVIEGRQEFPLNQIGTYDQGVFTIAVAPVANWPELVNGSLVLTWTLTPALEQLEVVVDCAEYEEWLPSGNLKDWNQHGGTPLYFRASLQTTDGQVPMSRASSFKFELLNVSSEPGVCMNRPIAGSADTKHDLRFESQFNQAPLVFTPLQIQDGGMTAVTPSHTSTPDYVVAVAGVSSFDFGAYGELKVTATVNGRDIVGYWKKDPAREPKPLLLPKRKPTSWIADKWKQDNNATDLGDTDDEENDPVGDGHHGDGLTLYEEYRGFSVNLKHLRCDPHRKDFFVCDRIGNAISAAGISLYESQSGLKVHSKLRPEEFNVHSSGSFDTMINFNHSPNAPHAADQHGVLLLMNPQDVHESFSEGAYGGTPAATGPILMGPHISRDGGWQTVDLAGGGRVITFLGAATVAHELAHTCAVWHHGDSDETVNWRKVIVFENGVARTVLQENGQEIMPLYESGAPAPWLIGNNVAIGVPQGQHSGNADCVMRYINAQAYRPQGNLRVRYEVDELKGIILCTSGTGTGVNGPRSPQPRYGDAASGRGNCKGQICVNDKYNGSSEHQR